MDTIKKVAVIMAGCIACLFILCFVVAGVSITRARRVDNTPHVDVAVVKEEESGPHYSANDPRGDDQPALKPETLVPSTEVAVKPPKVPQAFLDEIEAEAKKAAELTEYYDEMRARRIANAQIRDEKKGLRLSNIKMNWRGRRSPSNAIKSTQ